MKLNRKELKKIQYDFNSISSRLLQVDVDDFHDVLNKFLKFLDDTQLISDYITSCGESLLNMEDEVREVISSYGRSIFTTGDSASEEVSNVTATLRYISINKTNITFAMGYTNSRKYQDMIKGFNERFVMVLIRHIETYLTKLGIDMGLDERNFYNINVQNGQAIIANDNAVVTANANIGINIDELKRLIENIKVSSEVLSIEEKDVVNESLEVIEQEATSEKPKKSMLRTAMYSLKTIGSVAEVVNAVKELSAFISPLL